MDKNFYWWSGAIVFLTMLVAFLVINSQSELKKQLLCQSLRIRPLSEKFFTWNGILELNQKGEYQPKCI
ncbi:MAG: hypothetical protein US68_C0003G0052 [Candidatus Shapirobacteria bacterium GW2011_GWE1_38_10]|uniref:Uncharacterized protein n=1 Tax=Candidatus Shapirobacteria bacterium GW2011_GWE1_38_10 TaxID=1618488 RepID=A0A0G0LDH7_9BACT|nr:MAG: hypothetical protein US46_C0008G0022 [Candidatus Shapirobacteria bacterium GW2011_GWF2_37_20]KKQ50686.1 MAG: hypothetical protein US68_C0003G0052 [Candidatus Shapirobacteria bacterium GW2011_GWE1_38_10]KKQ64398.1 MAG: hypothetical protein US85_C0010G0030 [Candidatus Shapirobacteria bacterium GW2011_GWF1_38_23]HBP51613.1 hypothetical protein [Candidatus Shapirobacteria bacterium]